MLRGFIDGAWGVGLGLLVHPVGLPSFGEGSFLHGGREEAGARLDGVVGGPGRLSGLPEEVLLGVAEGDASVVLEELALR